MTNRAVLLTAAAIVLLAGCSGGADDPAPPASPPAGLVLSAAQRARIRSVVVQPTSFTPAVQTTGTVQFDGDRSTSVLAPISGPVTRVLVEPGARVAQGQPLALVSSPDFAAALADYRKALAAQRNAQHVADLDEQLFQADGIARREVEQAKTDAVAAAADLDAAAQQLRALGIDPAAAAAGTASAAQGVIRAPIAGTVVERLITPGQLLQAGTTPCFTIADLSTVWVMASVFPADLPQVAAGDAATITASALPAALPGRVDYVAALVDPATRATSVRIVTPNPQRLLKRDMYVDVRIASRRPSTGLLVPVSAVLRDEDNTPFVYADLGGGRYDRRDVTLAGRVGDSYQIAAGLKPGDRIVTEGGLFVEFAESQ
ncbi:MAG TPA: efflux RND transporter periplasmic adaptor subunit [Longimicrobiaceae bacterium]|nr:efflux RND transporter periplasmic adaptor subunit [Longimicrobiaceae bacterium]